MTKLTKKNISARSRDITLPARSRVLLLENIKTGAANPARKIIIGPNSRVQHIIIVDGAVRSAAALQRELIIGDNSQVDMFAAYFGGGSYRVKADTYLGKQANVTSRVLFWLKERQNLQVQDNYIFTAPATVGQFKIEGLIDDQASAEYYSDVVISPAAQETDSRIDMRLHLLSPQAKGSLLPGLKISANRVKAGHGASTFRLAPDDIFYLQTRGLSPEEIKKLIIKAVANQFAGPIADSATRDLLIKLITKRAL